MGSKFFGDSMLNPFFFAVSDKKPDKPKTATATDEEVAEAARREAELLRRRRGQKSTILTSSQGVAEDPTVRKQALG